MVKAGLKYDGCTDRSGLSCALCETAGSSVAAYFKLELE